MMRLNGRSFVDLDGLDAHHTGFPTDEYTLSLRSIVLI